MSYALPTEFVSMPKIVLGLTSRGVTGSVKFGNCRKAIFTARRRSAVDGERRSIDVAGGGAGGEGGRLRRLLPSP